jgi:hypothetical protein
MTHPVCPGCSLVLVWITLDGRPALVCPRATCTTYANPTLPVCVTPPNNEQR